MIKGKNPKISLSLSPHAQQYLRFVTAAFIVTGLICAGLYANVFWFVDRTNAYIMATELYHSMIRTTAAATMMTLLIDYISQER